MPKILGVENNRLFAGFILAVGVFLFWEEPDFNLKLLGMGAAFVLPIVFDKIFSTGKQVLGEKEITPDDLASPMQIKSDLAFELGHNSFENPFIKGYKISVARILRPPVFVAFIQRDGLDVPLCIGNALKKVSGERIMYPPSDFERGGFLFGARSLNEVVERLWPSQKLLRDREFKEMLYQKLSERQGGEGN